MNKAHFLTEIKPGLLSDAEKMELLEQLRLEIDLIDDSIVKLLHNRAGKSELLGALKKQLCIDNYSPEREREIINRVKNKESVYMNSQDLMQIFERIIDVSRSIQKRARNKE
jgi:chorismate mutase